MSGNSAKRGKKRPKSYYLKCSQQNKRKVNRLEVDIRGFLITCNSHEKDAISEAYRLLNEYADQMYGPEEISKDKAETADGGPVVSSSEEDEEEDIASALQKEVKAIKTTISSSNRRFQSVQTKAHNCLFIKTTLDDPCQLAYTIFTDLEKTRVQKSRYALRFLPIIGTCKAYEKELKELAEELLVKEFQTPFGVGLKYSVVFKSRNNSNNNLSRTSAQALIGQVIKSLNPLHSVNFDNSDVVVIVEVIGNICCLGTARDFFKFRKYNLVEVVKSPVETKDNKKDVDIENCTVKQGTSYSTACVISEGNVDKETVKCTSDENVDKEMINSTCEENVDNETVNSTSDENVDKEMINSTCEENVNKETVKCTSDENVDNETVNSTCEENVDNETVNSTCKENVDNETGNSTCDENVHNCVDNSCENVVTVDSCDHIDNKCKNDAITGESTGDPSDSCKDKAEDVV